MLYPATGMMPSPWQTGQSSTWAEGAGSTVPSRTSSTRLPLVSVTDQWESAAAIQAQPVCEPVVAAVAASTGRFNDVRVVALTQ